MPEVHDSSLEARIRRLEDRHAIADLVSAYGFVVDDRNIDALGALFTAVRYADEYRREDGKWRFADRLLSFLYYVPADEYAGALASSLKMRVYDRPTEGDWPESLPSWQAYHDRDDPGERQQ